MERPWHPPWVWGGTIARLGCVKAVSLLTFVTLIGAAIPLLHTSPGFLLASGAIFGVTFFSVPAATTAFARRNVASSQWPYAIGVFTAAFGIGRVVGPVLSGVISDNTGALSDGLISGCLFLAIGVVVPLLQTNAAQRR